jgi:hypothetical protein
MKPQMRSTKMSKASLCAGSSDWEILPKSVVPVRAFQPLSLLRISSAREMWRSAVEAGESLPTSLA